VDSVTDSVRVLVLVAKDARVTAALAASNGVVHVLCEVGNGLRELLVSVVQVLLGGLAAAGDELDEAEDEVVDGAVGNLENTSDWESDDAGGDPGQDPILADDDVHKIIVNIEKLKFYVSFSFSRLTRG
jgi:hypothetical protein